MEKERNTRIRHRDVYKRQVRTIAENYKLPYYTMSPTYSICKDHGYLIGEHFTCPVCGEKAEVYSRITGYYRPVQNWNEGKTQEYKNRQTYDIANSAMKRGMQVTVKQEKVEERAKAAGLDGDVYCDEAGKTEFIRKIPT